MSQTMLQLWKNSNSEKSCCRKLKNTSSLWWKRKLVWTHFQNHGLIHLVASYHQNYSPNNLIKVYLLLRKYRPFQTKHPLLAWTSLSSFRPEALPLSTAQPWTSHRYLFRSCFFIYKSEAVGWSSVFFSAKVV